MCRDVPDSIHAPEQDCWLISPHYKGNSGLSTTPAPLWTTRFYMQPVGIGATPHPIWVSALFLPKLPCGSFPIPVRIPHTPALITKLQNTTWEHHLLITNILVLEAATSPGVWNANSLCLGFPRFSGPSAQGPPDSCLVPLPCTVVWKVLWSHHKANL